MVFHGFWFVYMVFNVVSWFSHGFWLVSMFFFRLGQSSGRQGLAGSWGKDKVRRVNHLKKLLKPTKNHETTLKNHGNQPKTMKKPWNYVENHVNQPKTMKNHGNYLKKPWKPTSFGPKNVTSLTRGPNRPFRCLDIYKHIYFWRILRTSLLRYGKNRPNSICQPP